MPNKTGGKNYKKSKHSNGESSALYIERGKDQMVARVIRNLGNRNMLCYCNDNKTRLCRIRGSLRKHVWINVGDIVLISLRVYEAVSESEDDTGMIEGPGGEGSEKGDILAKYAPEHLNKLKKEPGMNAKLFLQLETMEGKVLAAVGEDKAMPSFEEDLFDTEAPVPSAAAPAAPAGAKEVPDDFDIDTI